jgi:excisionase family DNA binding protein
MTTTLLTKTEAADRLRVSVRSLDRLRSVGAIRTVRIRGSVRVAETEIERFITKCTAKAVTKPKELSSEQD